MMMKSPKELAVKLNKLALILYFIISIVPLSLAKASDTT